MDEKSPSVRFDRKAQLTEALERLEAPLVRYAAKILKDEERGRDVVQETFLRLWRVTGEAQPGPSAITSWLFTVCRNLAFDVLRKEHRMVVVSSGDVEATFAAPAPVESQEDGLSSVLVALKMLPPQHQEVVRLKFQQGFSYRDIARVTGLSESNVGFILHQSIKKLRTAVAAAGGEA